MEGTRRHLSETDGGDGEEGRRRNLRKSSRGERVKDREETQELASEMKGGAWKGNRELEPQKPSSSNFLNAGIKGGHVECKLLRRGSLY